MASSASFSLDSSSRTPSVLPLTLLILLILLPSSPCAAHSWLTNPYTYNKVYKNKPCSPKTCNLPCPIKWSNMNNSQHSPFAIYRRKQPLHITWVRNNHRGGFVRLAIVPVTAMWNRHAHHRLALHYACWDSGAFHCAGYNACGTDKLNFALGLKMEVPSCLPDGDYVFSYAWFGGVHFERKMGGFPDFHHCSHVRILGGPLGEACQPEFNTGRGPSVSADRTTCETSATAVSQCAGEPCTGKGSVFSARPLGFTATAKPSRFGMHDVLYVRDHPEESYESWPVRKRLLPPPVTPSPSPQKEIERPFSWRDVKCGAGVCCSPGCKWCATRENCNGGVVNPTDLCCKNSILRTGRKCGRDNPPCVCELLKPKLCPKHGSGVGGSGGGGSAGGGGSGSGRGSGRGSERGSGGGTSSETIACGGGVCCSAGCRNCASASKCHLDKTNDGDLCCRTAVLATRRSCHTHNPPCICRDEKPRNCPTFYKNSVDLSTPSPRPRDGGKDTVDGVPSPSPTGGGKGAGGRRKILCGGGVCCSEGCRKCAGASKCHLDKTKEGDLCCRNAVVATRRMCGRYGPPCVCTAMKPKLCPTVYV